MCDYLDEISGAISGRAKAVDTKRIARWMPSKRDKQGRELIALATNLGKSRGMSAQLAHMAAITVAVSANERPI
jgi:hypothetical protein